MRPHRSSSGQRAKRARQSTLADPIAPGSTQAVNGRATGNALTFGPFRFLPAQRMLLEGDKPLPLGSRALDILNLLLERPGEVIRKDEIIARVWPNIFVDETVVRTHIGALRKVLRDNKRANRYVSNVPGRGYVFVAPVASEEPIRPSAASADKREAIHNLPPPLARMVGRDDVVSELAGLLPQRRFMTIVGSGGIGKTTVALAVAQKLVGSYPDGICFVDLAPVVSPELVTSTVATALGVTLLSQEPVAELIASLRDRRMLLVIDNCEHLLDAVAPLAEQIVARASGVHLIATSRERLRAEGEWVHHLGPLGFPPQEQPLSAADALAFSAIALFVARARASLDTFEMSDADTPIVADICRHLDGIPLAIELAAAHVDAFGIRGLAERLTDRLTILTKGRRTALPRHQTLRATFDWSYHLLAPVEQAVLCRLAIFSGRFPLDAALAVAESPEISKSDVFDALVNLVAKSLVTADLSREVTCYRLLELTRAYAGEKLAQTNQAAPLARRHAAYCCAVLENAESDWEKLSKPEWLAAYTGWIGDVRAALDWSFAPGGDTALGIALTAASTPLWFALSLVNEFQERGGRALAAIGGTSLADSEIEMKLNVSLGAATFSARGPVPGMSERYARALELAQRLGATTYQLRALWGLAGERYVQGDYHAALAYTEQFSRLAEVSGDPSAALVRDRMMALGLHLVGRQAEARPFAERALDHPAATIRTAHKSFHEYDNRVAARSHLARILWLQGYQDRAAALAREGVAYGTSLNYPPGLCYVLVYAACPIAFWTGDMAAARHYVDLLLEQSENLSYGYWQSWRQCFQQALDLGADGSDGFEDRLLALRAAAPGALYVDMLSTLREEVAGPQAIARIENGRETWCMAEVLRAIACGKLKQSGLEAGDTAQSIFLSSLNIARRQGALSWELRSATSLARLRRDQHRRAEALDLLAPVYGRFSEGFATADLIAARRLLDEISLLSRPE
jgi:predicted ATPase/DNA-binding winged helix-turn-helix (wHTH) protein